MSNLDKKAIIALKIIKTITEEMKVLTTKKKVFSGFNKQDELIDIKIDRIYLECENVLKEYEARTKRLGEKENLSLDLR